MKKVLILIGLLSQFFLVACFDKELANVGGISIQKSEVNYRINNLDKNLMDSFGKDKMKEIVLSGIIEETLVLLDLEENGYDKDENQKIKWEDNIRGLSVHYFLSTFLPEKYPVSKNDLKAEYQNNRASFKKEERAKISHILVRIGKDFLDEQSALEKIHMLSGKIKKNGSNFNDIAYQYSDCPSGKDGGELGYMDKSEMIPQFKEVVFDMETGSVCKEPIRTSYGYHLLKVDDKEENKYMEIEEVKEYLSNIINIKNLRDEYKPELYPEKMIGASKDTIIGKTVKSEINYSYADILNDIRIFMGTEDIGQIKKDADFSRRVIDEMILARIMEDKLKELEMDKNKNYSEFLGIKKKEFFINNYIKDNIGSKITVTNSDIRKEVLDNSEAYRERYGDAFVNAVRLNKQIDRDAAEDIENKLTNELFELKYKAYIEELKEKYTVVIN